MEQWMSFALLAISGQISKTFSIHVYKPEYT